jgi:LacI family transcriptional regulator
MKNKISIKKISEMTGYSVATVSRVINNIGRYSKETEQKIQAVIKEYNYVPNMIAKGLRTNQIPTIGIIVPDITNEFFSRITLAAQTALFNASYSAFICNTNEKRVLEQRHLELMRAQNISGIIFVCSERMYDNVLAPEIPKVYVDRVPVMQGNSTEFYLIESDNYEGGRLAIRELVECGCKRIIGIFENRDISPKIARLQGVKDELAAHNMDNTNVIHYAQNITHADAYNIVNQLLDDGERFDGIFCYTDIIAMGTIKALTNRGISVPRAVKVVGFDDISISKYSTPSITTIHQPMEEMGTLAANLVLQLLTKEHVEQKQYRMPVKLIKRSTTKI